MYLTSEQYTTITGEVAPTNFAILLTLAENTLDRETLYFYRNETTSDLPVYVQTALKNFCVFAVHYLDKNGGIAAGSEDNITSMTAGKVSYTMGKKTVYSPAANDQLPVLQSYANTNRGGMDEW